MSFDLQFIMAGLGTKIKGDVHCTKTLMKILHPELRSGLGSSLRDILNVKIDKNIKHEWDKPILSTRQLEYAANDVLYLHDLRNQLFEDMYLSHSEKINIYLDAVQALKTKAELTVQGYGDVFAYEQNKYSETHTQRELWLNEMKKTGD